MNNVKFQPVPNHESSKFEKWIHATPLQIVGLLTALIHYIVCGIGSGYASVIFAHTNATGELEITKSDASWIASIFLVPMAPSCLLCGFLLTKLGKKTILIIISLLEFASWFIIYRSSSVTMILIGRALTGIAPAMTSPIIPPFLAEISRPNQRGLFLSTVMLGVSIGVLLIHILGAVLTWRLCALATSVIVVIYICFILYLPETYAWHFVNGKIERAETAFYLYRGNNANARAEFEKLVSKRQTNENCNYSRAEKFRLCFSKLLLMPLLIAAVATLTTHISAANTIMFYSITIVSQVIPTMNQYTSTIIVDVVRIIITGIASMLISKYPVRMLFITSGIGTAISHFAFSVFHYYSSTSSDQIFPILALISLLSYIIFSSIGIAPLPWVISGEIFPLILKGIGSGICTSIYFFTFFVVVKATPELIDVFGISGCFIFFGTGTLLCTIVMYFILPETKNKSLKEIEDLFR